MQLIALLKLRFNSNGRVAVPVVRRDLPGLLWGCRSPYRATASRPWHPNDAGLPVLPLPTARFRVPVWHTMSFVVSERWWETLLRRAMATNRAFYYLMHPVDLLDPGEDLAGLPSSIRKVERIMVPLKKKVALLRRSLDVMAERAEFVTMEALAGAVFT